MKTVLRALAALTLLWATQPAEANFIVTQGTGTTVVAIDAANQGTSGCAAATTECPASVLIDTTGTALSVTTHVLNTNSTILNASIPVTGTFFQATQPVSLTSLPALATGSNTIGAISNTSFSITGNPADNIAQWGGTAVTNVPTAVGTAGTGNTPTINAYIVGGSAAGGTSSNFSATFPTAGTAVGAEYLSAAPTYTTGQMGALQTDINGNLKVNVAVGGGTGGTSSSFGAAFPGTGTASGAEYLASPPTYTTGDMEPLQTDVNGNLKVTGSFSSSSFLTGGTYLNVSATTTSANSALPAGTNIVVYNYGVTKALVKLSTSGSTTVTAATADAIVQAGGAVELAIGSNTNIAYATTAQTATLQIVGGSGQWAGSIQTNLSVSQFNTAGAQPTFSTLIGGSDGTLMQVPSVTVAGTSGTEAFAVQGITSGVPILTNPGTAANWGILAQGSTTSGQLGQLAMGAVTTAAPTYTTAQSSPISLDTAGNIRVNCTTGCSGSGGTSSSFSATFPTTGTAAGAEYLSTPPTLTTGQMVAFQVTAAGSLHTTIDNSPTIANTSFGISGTLPAFAATPSFNLSQWNGTAITNTPTAVGTVGTGNTPTINAYIVGGAGSGGTALADNAAWTAGTTNFTPSGCEYTSGGATAITTAHAATVGCTTGRAFFTDKSSVAGTALSANVSALGTAATGTAVENENVWIVGCATGTCNANVTNAGTITAAASSASPVTNFNYVLNGSTWYQMAGDTSGRALIAGAAANGSAVAGNPVLIGGSDGTDARTLLMSATGQPHIICDSGCSGSGGTSSSFAATFPTTGTAAGVEVLTSAPTWTSGQMETLWVTTGGLLETTGANGTFPVTQATASNLNATVVGAGSAGTANAGVVTVQGIASMTPILANPGTAANWGIGAPAAAPPANAQYIGAVTGGATGGDLVGVIQANASVAINISTATTTQLIALSAGRAIYVTGWDVVAGGAGNITLEYGTGTACATGTTVLTGAYNLAANGGLARGTGIGPILFVPAGDALCALTSAAVQYSGAVSYAQF